MKTKTLLAASLFIAGIMGANAQWVLTGNANATGTSVIGTTAANPAVGQDLRFVRGGIPSGLIANQRAYFGISAGQFANTGVNAPNNTYIGQFAGRGASTAIVNSGVNNSYVGFNSGPANTTGSSNSFFGTSSGLVNTTGNGNAFFGANSGLRLLNGSANTFLGANSGRTRGASTDNTGNTFVGQDAGGGSTTIAASGSNNTYLGNNSGFNSLTGSNNIFIGNQCGAGATGSNNTFIGSQLNLNTTLSNNVVIGDGAGNQRLIINNTGATTLTGLAGANAGLVLTADNTGRLTMIAPPTVANTNIYNSDGLLATDRLIDMNNNNLYFKTANSPTNGKVYIGEVGNFVGNYKLYVEDGILTEKVRVALVGTANWADYVFAKDYKLAPLSEVEKYYTANKHLPNVPSSQELVSEGLDLGVMQAKQMEKIEELTLYIVEQNKAIETLKAQVNAFLEKK
jgi:trimeric autotransporter adhesin